MKRWSSRTLVFAIVAVTLAAASPVVATYPGNDGEILSFRSREFLVDPSYRTIMPDGSGGTVIEKLDGATAPEWSPDGSTIAYAVSFGSRNRIVMLDVAADTRTNVLGEGDLPEEIIYIDALAFGPTGDRLVFCATVRRPEENQLYVVGTDGTDLTMISGSRPLCDPDWSTTDRIVAGSIEGARSKLYTLDPDGTDVERIVAMTTLPSNRFIVAEEPSWSPDGGTIAFTAQEERRRGDVWLVDADGTDLRRLTDTPRRWETTAIFSPEGTSVVYSRGGRDYVDLADLWRSFVAGGRARVTDTARYDEIPQSWRPV